ncbi:DUF3574 domain-containing protein [Pseudoalteromonas sp. S16_S37]|uniref:DUF3574 domain-containing protein n=1 Tax=Pseudoalteromonas sp. S16_S37 TaxID=2720228 RepID=UPI0016817B23|nr:DUF3574 domain-containing protein [Pseudoalteromonas sp. S16_S37]MBD1584724.1 DUF3574 domain-containing protein [Pseudoalteromonas sp. S16_S37]
MNLRISVPAIALCLLTSACSVTHTKQCPVGEQKLSQESLYFGTKMPSGFVTEQQWASFLTTSVTPKFPQGLTVVNASGQWQGNNGKIIKEQSYVLTLVHDNSQEKIRAISEITELYKVQFQQEAVLRVQNDVCVSF